MHSSKANNFLSNIRFIKHIYLLYVRKGNQNEITYRYLNLLEEC